jgi:hypothetical protein
LIGYNAVRSGLQFIYVNAIFGLFIYAVHQRHTRRQGILRKRDTLMLSRYRRSWLLFWLFQSPAQRYHSCE